MVPSIAVGLATPARRSGSSVRTRTVAEVRERAIHPCCVLLNTNQAGFGVRDSWPMSRVAVLRARQVQTHGEEKVAGGCIVVDEHGRPMRPESLDSALARPVRGDRSTAQRCGPDAGPLRGILAVLAGVAVRRRERGMLLRAVMADRMHPHDLAFGAQLHRAGDDRDCNCLPRQARPAAWVVPANDTAPPLSTIMVTTGPTVG